MKQKIIAGVLLALLAGCAKPGQNRYGFQDVGQASLVDFGRVVAEKPVEITGKNTGTGAVVGAAAGAGAGSYLGSGSGNIWATGVGLLVGAIAGAAAEQAAADRQGIQYVITTEHGKTLTIVQELNADDTPIAKGERVMVETSGSYQRVLPADDLPEEVERPRGIKVRG